MNREQILAPARAGVQRLLRQPAWLLALIVISLYLAMFVLGFLLA